MAIEKNPDDQIPSDNVIPVNFEQESSENVNFQVDPDTGEIEVEFSMEDDSMEIEFEMEGGEFYENLAESLDEETLSSIGQEVYDNFEADKNSRSEWESMFERGFDLLGLKLEETT